MTTGDHIENIILKTNGYSNPCNSNLSTIGAIVSQFLDSRIRIGILMSLNIKIQDDRHLR